MDRLGRGLRVLQWTSVCAMYVLLVLSGTMNETHARRTGRELAEHRSGKTMRLKMMHRNAHNSPFRNPHETRLESLRSLLRHDKLRLAAFSNSVESQAASDNGPAEAPDYFEPRWEGARGGVVRAPIFSGAFVGSGQYFVDLEIGTPSKRFLLIADTGSDLVWVKCLYHSAKGRRPNNSTAARALDAHKSSTFSPVSCSAEECLLVPAPPVAPCSLRHPTSCKYMYTYSDRSDSTGVFAYETVTINAPRQGIRIPKIALGCSTRRQGQSFKGADGVIGLGQGPISFPSQIGYMYGDKFSYCLVDHLNSPSTSSNYLVFGDRNVEHLKSGLQYTPFLKNPPSAADTFYYLGVRGVNVDGQRLPIPRSAWLVDRNGNRGTIIDSGTTLSYVLEPAYTLLLAAFQRLVCYPRIQLDPFDLCFNSSSIARPKLPEFSIDLDGGATFCPALDNYFIDAAPDIKCLGILGTSSPSGFNVIGNIMQQNFFVEFDRKNSRLGFARTDCSTD